MQDLPALHTGKDRVEFGHVTPIDETAIPFAIIESAEPGPTLLITAGVHGSEFCSVEAAVRTMQTKPEDIKGTLAGSEKSKALAAAFGIPVLVAAGGAGYTVDAAGKLGIPSILPEVSGNGLWGEATVKQLTDGVRRVMQHLGMVADAPEKTAEATKVVTMWVPTAPVSGLWYPRKDLAETVGAGELLGEIKNVFGEVLASIQSEKAGFILYRPTSLSVNQGEALIGVGTPVSV
jgi:predicted deacylase